MELVETTLTIENVPKHESLCVCVCVCVYVWERAVIIPLAYH